MEFYLYYEPVGTFLFGQVGLYDAGRIVADVERGTPGSFAYRYGLLPFACNKHGDEYCFVKDGGGSESGVVLLRCPDDFREIGSKEELLAGARFCADSFDAFMRQTAEEERRRTRDKSYLRRFLNPGQRLKH